MANIKLTGNTWDTSGIYDAEQEKTQKEVNKKFQNIADSNEASLAASGYKNVYKNDFSQTTTNHMTAKNITDTSIVFDGTTTANTNFNIAFHSFPISQKMVGYLMCPDTYTGRTDIWIQTGSFDGGGTSHQGATLIYPNVLTKMSFPVDDVDSRFYIHFNPNVSISNTKFMFFVAVDDGNAFDAEDVQNNTFISDYNETSYMTYVDEINDVVLSTEGVNDQFLFFTDPHLAVQSGGGSGMRSITQSYINFMEAVYNASPMSFCVCGGDWLGNGDVPEVAASKLTFIDGFMRKKFANYIPINGNHDTNYQGRETSQSELNTGRIDNSILKEFTDRFRTEKQMYYSFNAPNSKWYVFDTGTENEVLDVYQNTQIKWFANALLSETAEHIVIAAHILFYSSTNEQPITKEILKIAQAYNAKTTITYDSETYNYASATGKVSFLIGGHLHADSNGTLYDIPYILTTTAGYNTTACTFDLCIADWEDKKLKMIRVGDGSNRTVSIL